MRAPISVIIPTLNAEKQLGACLMSLMPALEMGLIRELIVSDGGSFKGHDIKLRSRRNRKYEC